MEPRGGSGIDDSEVQAVANLYGVGNIESITTGSFLAPVLTGVFSAPGAWKRGSPVNYVRAEAPPFLVIHGTDDEYTPVEMSRNFVAAMREAGRDVEYLEPPGGHGEVPNDPEFLPAVERFLVDRMHPEQ